jgi:hypothetical protein
VSSSTWTPRAVASKKQPFDGDVWRAVEAQHVVSTLALVDSLEEQALLESLLEESKPSVSKEAASLHYLLATPFRYPPSGHGSRFRAPHQSGVFYGADEIRTACAELGFWRWRFLRDSPALELIDAQPQTVFRSGIAAGSSVDLRATPFNKDRKTWKHATDYTGTQEFADIARQSGVDVILYESVRDPDKGRCVALLTPSCFAETKPRELQTWSLTVNRDRVVWQRQSSITPAAFEFAFSA